MAFPEIPFATLEQLVSRWKDFPLSEMDRAEVLLGDASQLIVDECPGASTASALTLERIVCAIVKRAMQPRAVDGAESVQQGAGGYQATVRFANPDGDLYLTSSERRSLRGRRQRAGSVSMLGWGGGDDGAA